MKKIIISFIVLFTISISNVNAVNFESEIIKEQGKTTLAAAIKTKAVLEPVEQKEDDGAESAEKSKSTKNVNGDK